MKNQKVSTGLGTIILVIFTITAGMFIWLVVKNREVPYAPQQVVDVKKPAVTESPIVSQQNTNPTVNEGKEFPTIPILPGMSLEDMIRQAIYEKHPTWKAKNFTITVSVETNIENHAIGRFSYIGDQYNNGDGLIWFAAKLNDNWILAQDSDTYWGSCHNFKKYNFPASMTPDCWDTEKNVLVDTLNPQRFYSNGFTKIDKAEIIKDFLDYYKLTYVSNPERPNYYLNKDLYLKINKNTKEYFNGAILVGGIENHSSPYFLAVKESNKWKIVYYGQDIPPCSAIEPYKFPHEITSTCYDNINKKEKDVL